MQTIRNNSSMAQETKFANRCMGTLVNLTRSGDNTWTRKEDGTFASTLGVWDVSIDNGQITFVDRFNGSSGSHPMAATQTGRLLNLLVTVPGALRADREAEQTLNCWSTP